MRASVPNRRFAPFATARLGFFPIVAFFLFFALSFASGPADRAAASSEPSKYRLSYPCDPSAPAEYRAKRYFRAGEESAELSFGIPAALASEAESIAYACATLRDARPKSVLPPSSAGAAPIEPGTPIPDPIETNDPNFPLSFSLVARENCAFVFSVARQNAEPETQTVYFKMFDSEPPTFSISAQYVGPGDGVTVRFDATDSAPSQLRSATSGVKRVEIRSGSEIVYSRELNPSRKNFNGEVFLAYDLCYEIELVDAVGNEKRVSFGEYPRRVYNNAAQVAAESALAAFESRKYASSVETPVRTAFEEYKRVAADPDATPDERDAALADLESSLRKYDEANERLRSGAGSAFAQVSIDGSGVGAEPELIGIERAVGFLPIGDSVAVTLKCAKRRAKKSDASLIACAKGSGKADLAYVFSLETRSSDRGASVRDEFAGPVELRFDPGPHKSLACVQSVFSSSGEETLRECAATELSDGRVAISVPFASGRVYAFAEKKRDRRLWLLSLAVPAVAAPALAAFALRRKKRRGRDGEEAKR